MAAAMEECAGGDLPSTASARPQRTPRSSCSQPLTVRERSRSGPEGQAPGWQHRRRRRGAAGTTSSSRSRSSPQPRQHRGLCPALPSCAGAAPALTLPGRCARTPEERGAPLHGWHGGREHTEALHGSCQGKLVHFTTSEKLLCSRNILFPWATSYASLGTCRSIKLTSRSEQGIAQRLQEKGFSFHIPVPPPPAPYPDRERALNAGDHFKPSVERAAGVEKGLKKILRPGLEISCRFWSPLGSLRSPEQHLCRKRHLQNSKPRGSPAGHGPTTELRARAGKPILTVFRMADAVCENRRCAQEIRPGGRYA